MGVEQLNINTLRTSTMEHFEKQLTAIIIFARYNYFRNMSFSYPLVLEIKMIFKCRSNFHSRSLYST